MGCTNTGSGGLVLVVVVSSSIVLAGVRGRVVASQDLSDQEGGGRAQGSLDGEDGRRPSIPPQVFPDNQQVFVGNLPQYLSDKELHEFFGRTFFWILLS